MILAERAARDVERTARLAAEAAVAQAQSERVVLGLELERLRFQLAKARREAFGQSSEPGARIAQFELALEDIEETLAAIDISNETPVGGFTRRKPARRPLPRSFAARATRLSQPVGVPVLWRTPAQAR